MKCKFVALHDVLFHGGKNHGQKLIPNNDLQLDYDSNWDGFGEKVKVTYKGEATYLPMTAVQNFTPAVPELMEIKHDGTYGQMQTPPMPQVLNPSHPMDTRKIKSAQVSGPHDHVFQGEGSGKKRDK